MKRKSKEWNNGYYKIVIDTILTVAAVVIAAIGVYYSYNQYIIAKQKNYLEYGNYSKPYINVRNEISIYNKFVFANESSKIGLSIDIINSSSYRINISKITMKINHNEVEVDYEAQRLFNYDLLDYDMTNDVACLKQLVMSIEPYQSQNLNCLFFNIRDHGWTNNKYYNLLIKANDQISIVDVFVEYELIDYNGKIKKENTTLPLGIKYIQRSNIKNIFWGKLYS